MAAAAEDDRLASVLYKAYSVSTDPSFPDLVGVEFIVRGWARFTASQAIRGEGFWAFQAVNDAYDWSTDDQWKLILALLEAAPNDHVVEMVGVGPIEDWIGGGWEEGVARIEAEAPRNPRLRHALEGIWIDGIPEELFLRIERAAGAPLARFARREDEESGNQKRKKTPKRASKPGATTRRGRHR